VVREKLTNPEDARNFHYEPFQLFWKPVDSSNESCVHGELYSSPAFLDAHLALQDSPAEPGCTLPRVVVGMMLWSDTTHLTAFGMAKLWPCYLSFGNESKYHRSKPTCNLSNHVTYFQTVCHLHLSAWLASDPICSFQTCLRILQLSIRGKGDPARLSSHTAAARLCMPNGKFFSMTSFLKRTSMVSSLHAPMASLADFICGFLPILQITPRSARIFSICSWCFTDQMQSHTCQHSRYQVSLPLP